VPRRVSQQEVDLVLGSLRARLVDLCARTGLSAGAGRTALAGVLIALVLAGWAGYRWLAPRPTADPPGTATAISSVETSAPTPHESHEASPSTEATPPASAFVHIVGAVVHPGVYEVTADARLGDVVTLAGGFTGNAAQASVNLARLVTDGEQVLVLTTDEVAAAAAPPSVARAPATSPTPSHASAAPSPAPAGGTSGSPSSSGPPAATPPAGADGGAAGGLVNVNTAGAAELETLPGIGPATAAAIIEERERNGPFATVDDLIRVSGIGEKKLAAIRDLVCV
jgi:competence protein ComEA